jgi:hypothetical protein
MHKASILLLSLLPVIAHADLDCEMVTKDAASTISFNDRNAAIETLNDPEQLKCLLPEYIVRLHSLARNVNEEPQLKYPKGDMSNTLKLRELCTHELQRVKSTESEPQLWFQTTPNEFKFINWHCTIVIDGDYIDAMIQ